MPTNNTAGDFYNPPSNMSQDFEEYRFEDLEVDELFWQTNKPKEEQIPWRKTSLTEARNLKTQKVYNFQRKTKVFQKI
tara:strand:- start:6 stop:239 length:234 start_codon:yes stop_codon:yes gene_type:complete